MEQDKDGFVAGWRAGPSELNWAVELDNDLTLEEGVECLSTLMKGLSEHPNIDPQALQYKLIAALTGGGQ